MLDDKSFAICTYGIVVHRLEVYMNKQRGVLKIRLRCLIKILSFYENLCMCAWDIDVVIYKDMSMCCILSVK